MRRTLEVISLGLFLLGLELTTGTPSLTIVRLRESFANPLGAGQSDGIPWRSLGGLGLVLISVVMAGVTVVVRYRQQGIMDHDGCPKCGARTKRVRRTVRQRVLGRILGKALSGRHCADCGWRGLSYMG